MCERYIRNLNISCTSLQLIEMTTREDNKTNFLRNVIQQAVDSFYSVREQFELRCPVCLVQIYYHELA